MTTRIIRREHLTSTPWANQRGLTQEILTANTPTHWRASIATIDHSGPFSDLPHLDRAFTVITGATLTLTVANQPRRVPLHTPTYFTGAANTTCTLDHPTPHTALNLMWAPPAQGHVTVTTCTHTNTIDITPTALLGVVTSGKLRITSPKTDLTGTMALGDAVDLRNWCGALELHGQGHFAVCHVDACAT